MLVSREINRASAVTTYRAITSNFVIFILSRCFPQRRVYHFVTCDWTENAGEQMLLLLLVVVYVIAGKCAEWLLVGHVVVASLSAETPHHCEHAVNYLRLVSYDSDTTSRRLCCTPPRPQRVAELATWTGYHDA